MGDFDEENLRRVAEAVGFRVVPYQETEVYREEYSDGDWPELVADVHPFALMDPLGREVRDDSPWEAPTDPQGAWQHLPILYADDQAAIQWLLPWLQGKCGRDGEFEIQYYGRLGYMTTWQGQQSKDWHDRLAAALFHLCLEIIDHESESE